MMILIVQDSLVLLIIMRAHLLHVDLVRGGSTGSRGVQRASERVQLAGLRPRILAEEA